MSRVHNVLLTVGCDDWASDLHAEHYGSGAGINALNAWLLEWPGHGTQQLREISGHALSGQKVMEIEVWAGGINYLDIEGFVRKFIEIEWNDPSEVVLIIAPQEGAHEVYRPKGALEFQRPYEKCVTCERYMYEQDRRNNGHNCTACEPRLR